MSAGDDGSDFSLTIPRSNSGSDFRPFLSRVASVYPPSSGSEDKTVPSIIADMEHQ